MKIQFLGHSSFLITTAAGDRIITDPYDPSGYSGEFNYAVFSEPVDIVTVSHDHRDHAGNRLLKGSPLLVKGNGKFVVRDVEIMGVATYHDNSQGSQRGRNTVFVITADGLRVAHMGDLGHVLSADQAAEIGDVDVALMPVGGFYTIDAHEAEKVAQQIEANIVIPMHYRTEKCAFPIAGVEEFVKDKPNVVRRGDSVLEVTRETIPADRQIVVLEPEL